MPKEELNDVKKQRDEFKNQLKKANDDLEKANKKVEEGEGLKTTVEALKKQVNELEGAKGKLEKVAGKISGDLPKLPTNGVDGVQEIRKLCEASFGEKREEAHIIKNKDLSKVLMTVSYKDGKLENVSYQPMPK